MPVELPIPEVIPQLYVVLFHGEAPDAETLKGVVRAWADERVEGTLARLLPRFLDQLVSYDVAPMSALPLPPVDVLRYMGLGAEEEALLRATTHGIVISGGDLPLPPRAGVWATLCAARAVALHLAGVIFDPAQRRVRPLDEHDEGPPPDGRIASSQHVIVPASRDQEGSIWVTTLGLDRFGIPNLEVVGAAEHLMTEVTHLVNATAQVLIERLEAHALAKVEGPLRVDELEIGVDAVARSSGRDVESADAVARIGLTLDERDGRETLLRIHPPGDSGDAPGGEVGVWLEEVFAVLFHRDAQVVSVGSDDEAMEEAKARAIAELPEIRRRYGRGIELGDSVYVKAGFETEHEGFSEFMWVAVERWSDGTIRGRLANDPEHVPDLKAGQAVEIDEDAVCDWIWAHADGTREGGYTVDVLMGRR